MNSDILNDNEKLMIKIAISLLTCITKRVCADNVNGCRECNNSIKAMCRMKSNLCEEVGILFLIPSQTK